MPTTVGQPRSWISELRRRRVVRAVGIYVISGVAAVEAADLLFPRLGIPGWGTQLVLGLVIAGLPVAVALAWMYDLTPHGVRRMPRPRRPRERAHYEDALDSCNVAAQLSPDTPILHGVRCLILHRLDRHDDALEEERWFASRDAAECDWYAWSLAVFGGGDLDRAFNLLDRAFDERSFFLPHIRMQPRFRPLWGHPRYVALIERLWPGEQKQVLGEYGWQEASGALAER